MYRFAVFVLSLLMICPLLCVTAAAEAATVTLSVGGVTAPLPAGDSLPTPAAPAGKVFVGWAADGVFLPAGATFTPESDVTLTATFVGMATTGTLRVQNERRGLRFLTEMDRGEYTALTAKATVTYGTLIAPLSYAQEAGNSLHPTDLAAAGKTKHLDLKPTEFYAQSDTALTFAGSVIAVLPQNMDSAYVGAGYLKVSYTNGEQGLITAPVSAPVKLYDLANAAFADRTAVQDATHTNAVGDRFSPYGAADLAYLEQVLHSRVDLSYKLIGMPLTLKAANPYHTLPYTATFDEAAECVVLTVVAGSSYRFDLHFGSLILDGARAPDSWNAINLTVKDEGRVLTVKYREATDPV